MSVAASSNEIAEAEALRRAQRAHEPSMEEILASIRAIIADDREPSPPKPQIVYSSDAPRAAPSVEPLRLHAAPAPEPGPAALEPARLQVAPQRDEPAPLSASPTVAWSRKDVPAVAAPPPAEEAPLLSDEAESAVSAAFLSLTESMTAHGLEMAGQMAREMLRPMIKTWLDENLPAMVERLVRTEIQRVARGGR